MRPSLALLAAAIAIPACATAQSNGLSPDTIAAIDKVFARYSTATPGCALGVARQGAPLTFRSYGMADLEHDVPVRPETIFEAGSVSKQFTAFLVLTLEKEGKLSIDDPLRKYLPELPDYGAPLTIRHVLSHTSGLRDWYGVAEVSGLMSTEHLFRNADLLDLASRQKALNFPSGTEYLYSNTGWNLLAIVVERVTGESFQEAARKRIFEPIGMTHSRWRADFRDIVPGRAMAYAMQDGAWKQMMPFTNIIGAGGLLTTVGDLLRWNENLSTGAVGGEIVRRMATPARLVNGREFGYGLGLMIRSNHGTPEVFHTGSTGGYNTWLARYPQKGLSFALLCNDNRGGSLGESVADVFLGAPADQVGTVSSAEAAAMRGYYRVTRTDEPVEITMPDARPVAGGLRLSVLRRDSTRVGALLGIAASGDSLVLERVSHWSPGRAALAEYAGSYRSEEAPSTWRVSVSGDTLVLVGPSQRRIALRPAYQDAFTAPGLGTVRFRRDSRGRIVAASFLMGRVRDLRLARQ